jgi:outer membrane protein assembly factor BamE
MVIFKPARRSCEGSTSVSSLGIRSVARFLYDPPPLCPAWAGNSRKMKPIDRISSLRLTLAFLASLAGASVLPGCVYRPDIQQGNLLQTSDVDQVKVGMTRSQVRYILGTPMVSNPFDQQRWDYVYTFRRGRDRDVTRAHFIVRFDGDKVSSVETPDLPEETENSKIIKQQRARQAASAAAVAEGAAAAAAPATAAPDGGAAPPAAPPADSTDAPPADRPPGG